MSIFENMVKAVCTSRQSDARHAKNRHMVVAIIYKLVFAISQRCNFLQKENTLFMMTNNLNKDAMNTERSLASTCSSRTGLRILEESEGKNWIQVNQAISEATEHGWLIVASIDDFTSIHTHRRPADDTASSARSMATIVVSIFKDIPAVAWSEASDMHEPSMLHSSLRTLVTGSSNMRRLRDTYAATMPDWLTESFFDPLMTRHRLNAHEYYQSRNVQQLRSFDNLYLLEFKELPLKSLENFQTAVDWMLESNLKYYLEKYCILLPGDHPAQYFTRQIVYSHSFQSSARGHQFTSSTSLTPESMPRIPIQGIIPSIGPLHISLNAQENVMQIFHSVFKHIYEKVFPHSKLADKPKPWRTSLIFELVYGGWVLIRNEITTSTATQRSAFSSMLLNLFDNYLPLVLSIYALSFKLNNYEEYKNAVIRVWTMFLCFRRKNYNKSPLIWLSQQLYWQEHNFDLFCCVSSNLAAIDEYRVENTHSIIRGNTNSADTPEQLSRKAKAIFSAKSSMFNFKSNFSPPKNYTFSRKQLKHLKVKTSEVITDLFGAVYDPSTIHHPPAFLDPKKPLDIRMLPLAYHTELQPLSGSLCDMPGCSKDETREKIAVFHGCGHFFHESCMPSECVVCKAFFLSFIDELEPVIQEGLHPKRDVPEGANQTACNEHQSESVEAAPEVIDEHEDLQVKVMKLHKKISSFHKIESSIVGCHIEKKVTKHCKTCSHSSAAHKNKKDGQRTCALCPDQLCNDSGKNLPCICKDHISSEISGDCKVSNPKSNILVLQLPQFQDKDSTDSSLVSFLVGAAFLRGKLHNLSVSQLVKQFLKYTKDAGHLLRLKLENPNPSGVIEVDPRPFSCLDDITHPIQAEISSSDLCGYTITAEQQKLFLGAIDGRFFLFCTKHNATKKPSIILGVQCKTSDITGFLPTITNISATTVVATLKIV